MGAPTVYRFDDANAPVLTGEVGSCIDVLTACLVTGYGTKPAAGWTKPYQNLDNTIACFTNDEVVGSGMTIRVDHDTNATHMNYQAYETMSDVDSGLGPFHDYQMFSSVLAGAVPRQWTLIADNRIVYFIPWYDLEASVGADWYNSNKTINKYSKPLVFGDINSLYTPDPYAVVLAAAYTENTSYGSDWLTTFSPDQAINNQRLWIGRGVLGVGGFYETHILHSGGPLTKIGNQGSVSSIVPARSTNIDTYFPAYVRGDTDYSIRGLLPGLYFPGHSRIYYNNYETVTIGGKDFLCLYLNAGGSGAACQSCILMDISADFRP